MKRLINILIHLIVAFMMSTIFAGSWIDLESNKVIGSLELIVTISLVISAATLLYEPFAELMYAVKGRKVKYVQKLELRQAKHEKKLLDYLLDEDEKERVRIYREEQEQLRLEEIEREIIENEENQIQPENGNEEEVQP